MPRKKASAVPVPAPSQSGPVRIVCPACKSEISGDGSTLHSMSKYLEELIETAGDVEKLEKVVGELEAKLAAARAEAVKVKVEVAPKIKTEDTKNETVGPKPEQGKPNRNWW
ncbi:MAG TPA: hypothetical protein VFI38_13420 [Candidatus Acidoferrum sp.]|nr:hypothetical protein [Candidatus Acidoferrum sp.]